MKLFLTTLVFVLCSCTSLQPSPLSGCEDELLGEPMEGFQYRLSPEDLEAAIADRLATSIEELYAEPISGPVLRERVEVLKAEAADDADLWYFDGPPLSWEGIAAVRKCEVVAKGTLLES